MNKSLTKLLAALVDHLDLLTSQHQHNSRVLIDALEDWENQGEQERVATELVKNISLIKAYQGLDAMEQRLQFLRKALSSVGELVKVDNMEDCPRALDELMQSLSRISPVTTDGRFYAQARDAQLSLKEISAVEGNDQAEGSVILFDDEDQPLRASGREIE